MRKNSIKNTRINGEVQRELSKIIRERLKDPRVHVMTSVTQVEVAPDLKTCRVYISVLGSQEELKDTVAALRRAEGFIRRELARTVNLRMTPELTFIADDSIARGISMSKLIDEVMAATPSSDEEEGDAEAVEEEEEEEDEEEEEND
jgi:ribosome-binding factor A